MPLSAAWADALFAKLSVRYGRAFLGQWPDADPALVKADWAEVLHGFSGEAISHALRHLPDDKPPIAAQFRRLCLGWSGSALALPPPKAGDPSPEVLSALKRASVSSHAKDMTPAEVCFVNIQAAMKARGVERPSEAQKNMIDTMRHAGFLRRFFPAEEAAA